MSKIIAFSGGCFSGKTTAIQSIENRLKREGYNVAVLDEVIRTATKKPIDLIRKNPHEYLQLQCAVIREKMRQESEALADNSKTLYLADRAITDSLFYLQNYVDKSQLPSMLDFCILHSSVVHHAERVFNSGKYHVIEFCPLDSDNNNDKYRPENVRYTKYYEFEAISLLNQAFTDVYRINMNYSNSLETLYQFVKSKCS